MAQGNSAVLEKKYEYALEKFRHAQRLKPSEKDPVREIEEIEAIVSSGTRVNINYYIDDILDPENQEEIYDYFSEAETDDLQEAFREFDGDYSEEELRLMRIKFMSEMAN